MRCEPGKHLLRAVGCDQHLGRSSERHPLADVRSQGFRLPTAARLQGVVPSRPALRLIPLNARSDEAESLEDAPGLVRREVGSIQSGDAREHLFGRKTPAAHDDVMLVHRIGQQVPQAAFDVSPLELERLSGNSEGGHRPKVYSLVRLLESVSDGQAPSGHGPGPEHPGVLAGADSKMHS